MNKLKRLLYRFKHRKSLAAIKQLELSRVETLKLALKKAQFDALEHGVGYICVDTEGNAFHRPTMKAAK